MDTGITRCPAYICGDIYNQSFSQSLTTHSECSAVNSFMQNKMLPYPVMILPGYSVVPLNFHSCNGPETPVHKLEVGMHLVKLEEKRCSRTDPLPKWTLSCEALKTSGPDFGPNIRNQQHDFRDSRSGLAPSEQQSVSLQE